jgi:hypothetical protein
MFFLVAVTVAVAVILPGVLAAVAASRQAEAGSIYARR